MGKFRIDKESAVIVLDVEICTNDIKTTKSMALDTGASDLTN